MKKQNVRIIMIQEREDSQLKGPKNFVNKILKENFSNLKQEMAINAEESDKTANR